MGVITGAFWTIMILAASAIGAVLYIHHRDKEALQFQNVTALSQIAGAPATMCTYDSTQFGNGSGGVMYIADGRLRIDIKDLEYGGYASSVEAVVGVDGTRQIDSASYDRLSSQGSGAVDALDMILMRAPWKCVPWWFSDSSEFSIQNGVSF